MGTSLTGVNISASYLGLLKSTDSLAISTTAKTITDGAGNDLPIKLSTNQMLFGTGSASVPALSFNGNTSEGFYIPTDENIGVTIAGSEVARFNGSGITIGATKKLQFADDKINIGDTNSTLGTEAIGIGLDADATGNQSIAIGYNPQGTGAQGIAIGYNPTASGSQSTAIGYNVGATGTGTFVIGTSGSHSDTNTFVVSGLALKLSSYGSGNNTGTVTQRLGVTSSGQVVEIPIGGGAVDGAGTANDVVMWSDANTITDAPIAISSNDATFAGKITSSDDIIISNSSPELYLTTGGSHRNWLLAAQESIDGGFEIASQPSGGGSYDILFAIKGDTGNVAIGSTSMDAKLDITQSSATEPVLRLTDSGVANYDYIFPDSSTIKLETSTSSDKTFKLLNAGSGSFDFEVGGDATFAGQLNSGRLFVEQSGADMIDMTRSSVGTYRLAISGSDAFSIFDVGANADRLIIDSSGNLSLESATSLDFNVADFAQIKFKESGAITIDSDNNQSSRNFQIKDGSGSSLLFVGDDGKVSIGTTSPQTTFQVNGSASALNAHFGQGQQNSNGVFGGISLGYAETSNANFRKVAVVAEALGDSSARQNLHLLVDTASDSGSAVIADSKLKIDGLTGEATFAGNVGIKSAPAGNAGTNIISVGTAGSVAGGVQLWAGTGQTHFLQFGDESSTASNHYRGAVGYAHSSDTLSLIQGSVTALSFTGSQSATFAGNVNIENASTPLLTIKDTTNNVNVLIGADDTNTFIRGSSGSVFLQTNGSNTAMTLDSSQRVGIGSTSPASKAHVAFTADFDGLRIQNSTRGHNYLLTTAGTSAEVFSIYDLDNTNNLAQFGNAGISLYTGGTERLKIDSSGRLLLGQSSNTGGTNADNIVAGSGSGNEGISIFSGADSGGSIHFMDAGANDDGFISYNHPSQFMQFGTQASEKARITSGGILLVGKTSASVATAGIELQPSGFGNFTRASGVSAQFNRTSDDGNVIAILKDGTTVGVIGTQNSGLGTSTPTTITSNVSTLSLGGTNANVSGGIAYQANGTAKAFHYVENNNLAHQASTGVGQLFLTNNATALAINTSGNLGLGTTAPTSDAIVKFIGIVDSTSAGIVLDAPRKYSIFSSSSSTLSFRDEDAGSERLTLDSSGNFGVGTNVPTMKLTIAHADQDGLRFTCADGLETFIDFGDASDNDIGRISYDHADNHMAFRTNNSERARIDSSGVTHIMGASASTNNSLQLGYNSTAGSAEISAKSTSGTTHFEFSTSNSGTTSEKVRFTGVGTVGINQTSPDGRLHITFNDASGGTINVGARIEAERTNSSSCIAFKNPNGTVGTIQTLDSATSYNTSSDYRLKEDLQDFNALEIASKIKMYDFKWKADDSRSYGVMAHELQEVVPQAVSGEKDAEDMQQVDYSKLVPILLKSIQELEARVKELEKEI